MQPEELARAIATMIIDKKGEDVVMMDLSEVSTLTDYFIIGSADNERLLNAIAEYIREDVRNQTTLYPWRIEGRGENGWVLIDYGDVIVHLFDPDVRRYYDLEGLWRDAKVVVRMH